MTPCHAYVCLHLCFGLCDRTQRELRLTQMLISVRRAARRSRCQERRLQVRARLLGASLRCVCVCYYHACIATTWSRSLTMTTPAWSDQQLASGMRRSH